MIDSFSGEYRFLSNFYQPEVEFEGMMYPSTEHAYQAAKTLDLKSRAMFQGGTAGQAKRLGQVIILRDDWTNDNVKISVMYAVLLDKFTRHQDLRKQLIATSPNELIEGNTWNDTFWGVCDGKGKNHLGKLLMSIRQEIILQTLEDGV